MKIGKSQAPDASAVSPAGKQAPTEPENKVDAEQARPMEMTPPAGDAASPDAAPGKPPVRLGEKLVQLGLISPDQLQIVLTEQRNTKKLFGAILVEMGFITESALGEVLAESSGTQKFDPK